MSNHRTLEIEARTMIPALNPQLRRTVVTNTNKEQSSPAAATWDERRSERRIQTDDAARMQLLSPPDPRLLSVRIADVSKNGVRLLAPIELPVGGLVQLRLQDYSVVGEVRHCRRGAAAYSCGISIRTTY